MEKRRATSDSCERLAISIWHRAVGKSKSQWDATPSGGCRAIRLTVSLLWVERLLGEEGYGLESGETPAFVGSLHLEPHLTAVTLLGGKGVAGLGVHVEVGNGEAEIFVGADLEKLIPEPNVVVKAEEGVELLTDLREVGGGSGIERAEEKTVVAGLDGALERRKDVAYDLVGKADGVGGSDRLGGSGGRSFLGEDWAGYKKKGDP